MSGEAETDALSAGFQVSVNFSSGLDVPPAGYVRDFGEAYGPRSGAHQGSGLQYGWVVPGSATPLNLSVGGSTPGNGRNRMMPSDVRLATFMHMQGNHVSGFNGTASAGSWEMAVPTGGYRVTLSVGDSWNTDSRHRIVVEGKPAIVDFIPTAATKFASATVDVTVVDGRLTIDASGGVNTKIDYVDVVGTDSAPTPWKGIAWTPTTPTPVMRVENQGGVIGDKLYICGGYDGGPLRPNERCDAYHPATQTWQRIADMPVPVTHGGAATDESNLYIAGGYPSNGSGGQLFATTSVRRYNPTSNAWAQLPDLPEARGSGGLARVGRNLHFFGGVDGARVERVTHWILNLDAVGLGWKISTPLPKSRSHMGAASLNGKIYAIGGQIGTADSGVVADVHVFDPLKPGAWAEAAKLPSGRGHIAGATVVAEGQILVLGGVNSSHADLGEVIAYNPATNVWTALTPLPPRHSGMAGFVAGKIIYAGGSWSTSTYSGTPSRQ